LLHTALRALPAPLTRIRAQRLADGAPAGDPSPHFAAETFLPPPLHPAVRAMHDAALRTLACTPLRSLPR
jgi:hypothetical protein